MITQDIREAMDGMITTRYITASMHRIMRIMTGVITKFITRIIIDHSRHAESALRKISTSTIIMTTIGGTFGNKKARVRKQFSSMEKINVLWPGLPLPRTTD